jgi:DNA repair protein RadD
LFYLVRVTDVLYDDLRITSLTVKTQDFDGTMSNLRHRQQQALADLRAAYQQGFRAPVLCAVTGFGKTHTSAEIIRSAVAKGRRVWFLAHLREILFATSGKLIDEGIEHGFVMAGRPETPDAAVQVVMVQTAVRRLGRYAKPDLIVIDECHLAAADTYSKVIADAGSPLLLGLTATPTRLDGKGLGDVFDTIVPTCSTADLIAEGLLAPIRYYAPSRPDMTGVRTVAGEYVNAEVTERMDRPSITGDAVAHYRKLAHGRPCVVFCASVQHALNVAREFSNAGYTTAVLHGQTVQDERDQILAGLASGAVQVVVNCQLLVAGVDVPAISCIIQLAPTKSLTKYLQSIGRGLRAHDGKNDCIVLDHAGNAFTHGLPTEPREWSLDGAKKRTREALDVESVRQCEQCFFVHEPAPVCPNCGHQHPVKPRVIKQADGDLEELTEIKREKRKEVGRARTISDLIQIAKERGYAMGWVWQMARIKGIRA